MLVSHPNCVYTQSCSLIPPPCPRSSLAPCHLGRGRAHSTCPYPDHNQVCKVLGVHIGVTEISRSGIPARENTCSTLASCDRWEAVCLKTMKCSGKRSRNSHSMANWLSKDQSSTNSEKLSGESRFYRSISSVTGPNPSFCVRAAGEPSRPSTSEAP